MPKLYRQITKTTTNRGNSFFYDFLCTLLSLESLFVRLHCRHKKFCISSFLCWVLTFFQTLDIFRRFFFNYGAEPISLLEIILSEMKMELKKLLCISISPISLSISITIYLYLYLPPFLFLSISFYLSFYLYFYLSHYLSFLSIYLSFYLSISPRIHLSVNVCVGYVLKIIIFEYCGKALNISQIAEYIKSALNKINYCYKPPDYHKYSWNDLYSSCKSAEYKWKVSLMDKWSINISLKGL